MHVENFESKTIAHQLLSCGPKVPELPIVEDLKKKTLVWSINMSFSGRFLGILITVNPWMLKIHWVVTGQIMSMLAQSLANFLDPKHSSVRPFASGHQAGAPKHGRPSWPGGCGADGPPVEGASNIAIEGVFLAIQGEWLHTWNPGGVFGKTVTTSLYSEIPYIFFHCLAGCLSSWQDYEEWEKKQKEERRLQAQVHLQNPPAGWSVTCTCYPKTYLRNNARTHMAYMGSGWIWFDKFHMTTI